MWNFFKLISYLPSVSGFKLSLLLSGSILKYKNALIYLNLEALGSMYGGCSIFIFWTKLYCATCVKRVKILKYMFKKYKYSYLAFLVLISSSSSVPLLLVPVETVSSSLDSSLVFCCWILQSIALNNWSVSLGWLWNGAYLFKLYESNKHKLLSQLPRNVSLCKVTF